MHSLETGIVVSIAAFFFFSFLTFVFLREENIVKEINGKIAVEESQYDETGKNTYRPEVICNVSDIIIEGVNKNDRDD